MSVQVSLHQDTLPQQLPSPELPENDVGLVSYYLNCCVVGCAVPVDVPSDLLDYANVHRLPLEQQHAIYSVAIHVFQLDSLLDKIIFIDDHCNILPQQTPNMFLSSDQQAARLARFVPSFAGIPSTSGKIMICTSDWLRKFYLAPLTRYTQASITRNTPVGSERHDAIKANRKCQDFEKEHDHSQDAHVEADDGQHVPMAVAVLIEGKRRSWHDELCVSIFLPGQLVKLSGLVYSTMNDELAIVQERSQDRVLVRIPGDPRRYSVSPENLIVVEGSVDLEALSDI
jgi:hypothetical protein